MASPTTTLPSATLAAVGGGLAHASAARLYLAGTTGITAVLAIPLMKRAPALVEA